MGYESEINVSLYIVWVAIVSFPWTWWVSFGACAPLRYKCSPRCCGECLWRGGVCVPGDACQVWGNETRVASANGRRTVHRLRRHFRERF